VLQGIDDKLAAFDSLRTTLGVARRRNRLRGRRVGRSPGAQALRLRLCAAGSARIGPRHVHYVTRAPAGVGAGREICDLLMKAQGSLDAAHARYLA